MKKQEMADVIFQMLSGILSETEFKLKKGEAAYVRKISNGRQIVGVPLWDYNPEFEFSLNICIRLDAVEQIFHLFSGSPQKYHSMSFTTMSSLEYFTGALDKYRVTTAGDVASVGNLLSDIIHKKIIPFLNEHANINSLDKAVNCEQSRIDKTQNPSAAMHAIILAHLVKNKDFDRLVAKQLNNMQLAPEAPHSFNRLVEYLKTH